MIVHRPLFIDMKRCSHVVTIKATVVHVLNIAPENLALLSEECLTTRLFTNVHGIEFD